MFILTCCDDCIPGQTRQTTPSLYLREPVRTNRVGSLQHSEDDCWTKHFRAKCW